MRPARRAAGQLRLVHLTTTDMSLDWLLGPQLRAFATEGYEVIGMSAPGPHVAALEAAGVRHVPLPAFTRSSSLLQDVRAFVQLVRGLRTLRPDILHTHNPKPGVLGRIAGRLTGVPLVVNTQHGLYAQPADRWQRRLPVYALERLAAAFSHLELVQNEEDVRTLVHTLRVPRRRVRLLGNGIDLERFAPQSVPEARRAEVRAQWGIGADELLFGAVGRLVAEKGLVELVHAMAEAREHSPHVRLVVVGPADEGKADSLPQQFFDAARRRGVVFAGSNSDMPECYAAMDVFVTASWREGFPRAAMEAAAMGLPTVASDIRGNRQVVVPGETGLLVPVRDAHGLATACLQLANDADERRRMGSAAVHRAEQEFGDRRVIERTLAAYRQLRPRP